MGCKRRISPGGPTRARSAGSSSSSSRARIAAATAQFSADARLISAFDRSRESGTRFDYSAEVLAGAAGSSETDPVPAYLSKIQRGGLIQPFGCLLCLDPVRFTVLAHSENAAGLLGPGVYLGADARGLFAPSSSAPLSRAVASPEPSLLNPVWVRSASTNRHFYAILHRLDSGVVVDLEPAMDPGSDPGPSALGAVQSQKLAARVVSRLQSLPGGDVSSLCSVVAGDVRHLTGYDRVMVYRFHDDEHGEVVAESRRSDLEPYLGLHYPATDIPQAARFLFRQNRVRMICDCTAPPVGIVEDPDRLRSPLCLVSSTVRAPHPCHAEYMANMGSIASLAMAITVSDHDSSSSAASRLWGLLVCHHTSVRYVPFPLRHACEFLVQAFSLRLGLELQLAKQKAEKRILRVQAMLSDALLRDGTLSSVVTGSPTILDLVKCDGAALYCNGRFHVLGVAPMESELEEIVRWLDSHHRGSTGLSTESLLEAGFPGAAGLGERVCGMACAMINQGGDIVFWFRSPTSKEVRWGGAKHDPEDRDSDVRMHPRLSFNAFLEVVKTRSLPWEAVEIDAIRSLQLVMREMDTEAGRRDAIGEGSRDGSGRLMLEELSSAACEMVRLIETATVPVIAVNCAGCVNGWNGKAADLTGLSTGEVMGRSLAREIVHEDSRETAEHHLSRALQGHEDRNIELKLRTFGSRSKELAVFIVANACISRDYMQRIVGVSFVGQDVTGTKVIQDKFVRLQGDYKAIVQCTSPLIPPLFICDESSCCLEWNAAMESLTGWTRQEVLGKILPGEIFGGYCQLKGQDALTKFKIALYEATVGRNTENEYFGFYNKSGKFVETLLMVSGRTNGKGEIVGSICFLQTRTPDLQQVFELHRQKQNKWTTRLQDSAYLKQELRNPIRGLKFARQLLEASGLSEEQRKLLDASAVCEKQILKIVEDTELESIENGTLKLDTCMFTLETVVSTITSQVMPLVEKKRLRLDCRLPEEFKTVILYGDQIRLQQVLVDFLLNIVQHATCSESPVEFEVMTSANEKDRDLDSAHFKLRISHTGCGLPSELVEDMFYRKECLTHEGLALNASRKLLRLMDGNVQYVRESERSYFLVSIKLQLADGKSVKQDDLHLQV